MSYLDITNLEMELHEKQQELESAAIDKSEICLKVNEHTSKSNDDNVSA